MPTSRSEIANAVMICKKGHVRCPMATSKPFVVCSVSTKRYAPSTRGVSRHGSLPVVPKAEPRRPFAPSKPFVVCSLSTKRYAPSKRASTRDVSRHGSLPRVIPKAEPRRPRPSYFACSRNCQSSIGVVDASRERQSSSLTVIEPSPGSATATARSDDASRLTQRTPITYHDAMSPSWSPDLSSFPSQSWRVVTNAEVKQTGTPSIGRGDQNLSSMAATPRSDDSSALTDSCGPSMIGSSSPTQSSPPTVIAPSPSLAKPTAGSDGTSKISSPANGTCAKVSYMTAVPTIISKDATTSLMTMLASLMDRQVSSLTAISENSRRSRMMVRRAMEITWTFLSSSRSPSQLSTKTTSPKTMGINVSQLRKLFIPKLDKNANGSMSPTMQTETEILRAQKMVDRRLNRLGSLAPMASALKSVESPWSGGGSWLYGVRFLSPFSASSQLSSSPTISTVLSSTFHPLRPSTPSLPSSLLSSPSTIKSCTLPTLFRRLSTPTGPPFISSELHRLLRRLSYVSGHPTSNTMSSLLSCLRASQALYETPLRHSNDCRLTTSMTAKFAKVIMPLVLLALLAPTIDLGHLMGMLSLQV